MFFGNHGGGSGGAELGVRQVDRVAGVLRVRRAGPETREGGPVRKDAVLVRARTVRLGDGVVAGAADEK